ncbi:MAG: hypothetical protein JWQ71_1584 [Pedosphaera sp.]|nr:hypothetical protein [Pedosphaera sp.]
MGERWQKITKSGVSEERKRNNEQRIVMERSEKLSMKKAMQCALRATAGTMQAGQSIELAFRI